MSDLRELYQTTILDHSKAPRNFGPLPDANRRARGHNPLCGDQLTLYLDVADGRVRRAGFEGSGCAISTASASMLTEIVEGKTVEEAKDLFERFHALVAGEGEVDLFSDAAEELGKLAVFGGVREFPMRVKCATLAWHAMTQALSSQDEDAGTVKTE
ncbi:MAG: SUF system NifU family Fe-S cluster assembly protein [Myxococcales bacterium]|nr:SUF system NifU family Fe-S cluster assembly protein [Myxococcales bacterium]